MVNQKRAYRMVPRESTERFQVGWNEFASVSGLGYRIICIVPYLKREVAYLGVAERNHFVPCVDEVDFLC